MIASGAVPAPLPAHIGVSQTSQLTPSRDFADPLAREPRRSRQPVIRCGRYWIIFSLCLRRQTRPALVRLGEVSHGTA
jgi:hypothetical protein